MRYLSIPIAAALAVTATTSWAETSGWPVTGGVVNVFAPPDHNWHAGHRGVDLRGQINGPVKAPVGGQIIFSGLVAGKPVVVISHGERRTTYEPVTGSLPVGSYVEKGQIFGILQSGHEECHDCLHWGLKIGDTYLDPLTLIESARILLLPNTAINIADQRAKERRNGIGTSQWLSSIVTGTISSEYGWRIDPFSGERKWHSGIDIAAECSAPVMAPMAGRIIYSGNAGGYGNRIVIDHGQVNGHRFRTTYNHLDSTLTQIGIHVPKGQIIGTVGSTGASTGCHLHLEHEIDGALADPKNELPK